MKTDETIFSDEEHQSSYSRTVFSSIDTDADESDNEQSGTLTKARRLQKTRKTSISSLQSKIDINKNQYHHHHNHHYNYSPPLSRTLSRNNEHPRTSSNDDEENRETICRLSESNFITRRVKLSAMRKSQQFTVTTTATATTTTDEDINKQSHPYQSIHHLSTESATTTTTESNLSSPIPSMIVPVRKVNRFQVKSIRKSQQPQILLASATAAKSSNDDDCSVPNGRANLQLRPAIIERHKTNTPTTDGEASRIHPDNSLHGMNTGENEQHSVRFQVKSNGKQDLNVQEEKLAAPSATTVIQPIVAPHSSNIRAQGEVIHFY
jgi:hypothetical protein